MTVGTAVIYARFSCSKQREASIDDQLRVCRDWCAREGYAVVAECGRNMPGVSGRGRGGTKYEYHACKGCN